MSTRPLTRDEQRAARAARRLAADALIHDTFPESHNGGGSSFALGWPNGHRTDWDRKAFRVERYDIEARKPITIASVTWSAIRHHGMTAPDICEALRAAIARDRLAGLEYHRNRTYHEKGDPDAQPWARRTFGPINQPAIDAAWDRVLTDQDAARTEISDLLDRAFPLAVDDEPTDLLELLGQL